MDSPSDWVTPKTFIELFFIGIFVLKYTTSLGHRSLNSLKESSSKLLHQAHADSLKVIWSISHCVTILNFQLQATKHILHTFSQIDKTIIVIQAHSYRDIVLRNPIIQYFSKQREALHMMELQVASWICSKVDHLSIFYMLGSRVQKYCGVEQKEW